MAIGATSPRWPGRRANMAPMSSTVTVAPAASAALRNQARTWPSRSVRVSRQMPPLAVPPMAAVSISVSHSRTASVCKLLMIGYPQGVSDLTTGRHPAAVWPTDTSLQVGESASVTTKPLLFTPVTIQDVTLKNRVVIAPMATYSAVDGIAQDFHFAHLGRLALGGAACVFVEATAVTDQGRITNGDMGLWSAAHIPPLQRIAQFMKSQNVVP